MWGGGVNIKDIKENRDLNFKFIIYYKVFIIWEQRFLKRQKWTRGEGGCSKPG